MKITFNWRDWWKGLAYLALFCLPISAIGIVTGDTALALLGVAVWVFWTVWSIVAHLIGLGVAIVQVRRIRP